jgi:hypothetical protein
MRLAGRLTPLLLLLSGCGQPTAGPVVTTQAVPPSTEPGEMELSEPKVTFSPPNRVRFEVRYRFTKGRPDKYYLCEVTFPGTSNHAAKPMESWELKPAGVIKDTIILSNPPVEKFEVRVSEAESPQNGYKNISNVVSGPVQ